MNFKKKNENIKTGLTRNIKSRMFATLCFLFVCLNPLPVLAQQLLSNPSFESPVATANGNNLGVVVPSWSANYQTNIVKPYAGYLPAGPDTAPTGGGTQYLDINSNGATATVVQNFTVPQNGMIDFSAWFSIRDSKQAGTATLSIVNSGGTAISTTNVSFLSTENQGLWKQALRTRFPINAGTYTFTITLPDIFNVDLTSVIFSPTMSVSKTVVAYSDPLNGTTNPKVIPGSFVNYNLVLTNNTLYTIDSGTIIVSDATPTNLALFVGDTGGTGSGPVVATDGSPASGLGYTFTSLASTTDSVDFSNNNGTTWTYTPVPDSLGTDTSVTNIRIKPTGSMGVGRSATLTLRYRVK